MPPTRPSLAPATDPPIACRATRFTDVACRTTAARGGRLEFELQLEAEQTPVVAERRKGLRVVDDGERSAVRESRRKKIESEVRVPVDGLGEARRVAVGHVYGVEVGDREVPRQEAHLALRDEPPGGGALSSQRQVHDRAPD